MTKKEGVHLVKSKKVESSRYSSFMGQYPFSGPMSFSRYPGKTRKTLIFLSKNISINELEKDV